MIDITSNDKKFCTITALDSTHFSLSKTNFQNL